MGDVALASAAAQDLVHAFPGRTIDLNTLAPWDALYRDDPRFGQVYAFQLRRRGQQFREGLRWLKQMAAARYDLVVDLQTTDRSRVMIAALGLLGRPIPYRLGNKPAFPYNIAPPSTSAPRHALDIMRDTLRAGGITAVADRPVLFPSADARLRAQRLCAGAELRPGRFAVFLPGCQAAGYLKRWGAQRYAALAALLVSQAHVERVVLLGGPDERDECAAIASAGDHIVDLCGQTALLEVTAICQAARVVVGNDTGTGHLAAAGTTPVVVVCGPTDPRRVKPAGPHVHAIQAQLPCINCYRKQCAHHSCMRVITAQAVLERIVSVL